MKRNLIVTFAVIVVLTGLVIAYAGLSPGRAQPGLGAMAAPTSGPAPVTVKGYAEGWEILFVHTEASDAKIAQTLTSMINAPVLDVPSLAQIPPSALDNVFVFANGVKDGGPLGFQPDVFDEPPPSERYTPLRALNLVTWKGTAPAHVLTSAAAVKSAEAQRDVSIQQPGVVIDMPLVTWPGGQR